MYVTVNPTKSGPITVPTIAHILCSASSGIEPLCPTPAQSSYE
jgi:hypothetical protein